MKTEHAPLIIAWTLALGAQGCFSETSDDSGSGDGSTTGTTGDGTDGTGSGGASSSDTSAGDGGTSEPGTSDQTDTTGGSDTTAETTGETTGQTSTGETTGQTSTGETTGQTSTGDTSSTGAACPGTHMCVPNPGGSWSDVFSRRTIGGACSSPYASERDELYEGLDPGEATCACSCGGSPSGNCGTQVAMHNYNGSCGTGGVSGGALHVGDGCFHQGAYDYWTMIVPGPTSLSCADGSVTPSIDTPTWDGGLKVCDPTDAPEETCPTPGDLCMPTPVAPQMAGVLCVSAAGNQTCPAGFPQKSIRYEAYDDTRSCPNSCGCDEEDSECVASYTEYQGVTCGSQGPTRSLGSDAGESCVIDAGHDAIILNSITFDAGTCAPGGTVNPTGNATPTGQTTVCCT